MGFLWIAAALLAHALAWIRARRRFDRTRVLLMRAEAQLRQALWGEAMDPAMRTELRVMLRRHGLADARFSEAMFPRIGGDALLSEGLGRADPAIQGRLRIALYRIYGAERAILEETRSIDALIFRFCLGPVALIRSDTRPLGFALRLVVAVLWLAMFYAVLLPRLF
jgi:hypothetical protein